jgi:dTDP-4-dehydrorhamnose reductase
MTRILVTGKDGQVGHELLRALAPVGEVIAFSRADLDLADLDRLREHVRAAKPDWIVNAAAYTAVDKAESEEALATRINGEAPGVLAEEAKRLGAGLIHFSTDYVFSGDKQKPYVESDPVGPINAYGRSKLDGERRIQAVGGRAFIFRTSWVYSARGRNFVLSILKLAKEKPQLQVVADQFGAPTSSRDLADASAALIAAKKAQTSGGLFHLAAAGRTSWYGFAQQIVRLGTERGLCRDVSIAPIPASQYQSTALRPANSVMDCRRAARELGLRLPSWLDSLRKCIAQIEPHGS